jgi:hypothetical protein
VAFLCGARLLVLQNVHVDMQEMLENPANSVRHESAWRRFWHRNGASPGSPAECPSKRQDENKKSRDSGRETVDQNE